VESVPVLSCTLSPVRIKNNHLEEIEKIMTKEVKNKINILIENKDVEPILFTRNEITPHGIKTHLEELDFVFDREIELTNDPTWKKHIEKDDVKIFMEIDLMSFTTTLGHQ